MKNVLTLLAFLLITPFLIGQNEDLKSISYFEKYIINGYPLPSDLAITKYGNDYRVILWNEPLIKSYKYSNESFDTLGYSNHWTNKGDHQQSSKIYRNCKKGIIVTVTEWYDLKYSISMEWISKNQRNQFGNLASCYLEITSLSREEIEYELQKSAEEKALEKMNKDEVYAKSHVFDLRKLNFDVTGHPITKSNTQELIEKQIIYIYKSKKTDIKEMNFRSNSLIKIDKNGDVKGIAVKPKDISNNFIEDINFDSLSIKYGELFYKKHYPIYHAIDELIINYNYKITIEKQSRPK